MKKVTFYKEPFFFELSKFNLIIGICLGFLYSFFLYGFLYIIREIFRFFTKTDDYDLLILNDNEVYTYNLIFALIALIIGQSICFSYWFDRPKKKLGLSNYRKSDIINDQRMLNWNFLNWFLKLIVVIGITFSLIIRGGYYVESLLPDFYYSFFLLILVLYLQTWNTLRLRFKKKSLKLMLIIFIIILTSALILSRINFVNYKAINSYFSEHNIIKKHKLELPKANVEDNIQHYIYEKIYLIKQPNKEEPKIIFNNNETSIHSIIKLLTEEYINCDKYFLKLYIDHDISMLHVNKIKMILAKNKFYRLSYAIIPQKRKYNKNFYKNSILYNYIGYWNTDSYLAQEFFEKMDVYKNTITIQQIDNKNCIINNSNISINKIKPTLKKLISSNYDYSIKLYLNSNCNFSNYIKIIASIKLIIKELRLKSYKLNYSSTKKIIDPIAEDKISKLIPYRVIEFSPELKQLLKQKQKEEASLNNY